MDKKEAIEFLKKKVKEISALRELHHSNQGVIKWRNSIEDVLEEVFGRDSTEFKRFYNTRHKKVRGKEYTQKKYNDQLRNRETAIISIINKWDIIGIEAKSSVEAETPKAFISHGRGEGALIKLEKFVRELGVIPIIVKNQPNADRTVDDKVNDCLKEVDFVIIFATGDDEIKTKDKEKRIFHPRQNVIHEIGLAQKTHPGKIIYLLEGKATFPSNINPKVYYKFERNSIDDAFTGIVREMRNWGFLESGKP